MVGDMERREFLFESSRAGAHGGWRRFSFVRRAGPSHVHARVGPRTDERKSVTGPALARVVEPGSGEFAPGHWTLHGCEKRYRNSLPRNRQNNTMRVVLRRCASVIVVGISAGRDGGCPGARARERGLCS